jgi:hypothetical protein
VTSLRPVFAAAAAIWRHRAGCRRRRSNLARPRRHDPPIGMIRAGPRIKRFGCGTSIVTAVFKRGYNPSHTCGRLKEAADASIPDTRR